MRSYHWVFSLLDARRTTELAVVVLDYPEDRADVIKGTP